jgi:23S rRNA (pseudouridine1915-N3)-methyltransferase
LIFDITLFSVGKNKESWLDEALSEYEKRLKGSIKLEWVLLKNDVELEKAVFEEKNYIALDPLGKAFSSEEFSRFFIKNIEQDGGKMRLVIGSSEGLTPKLRSNAKSLISLSLLTFTHQITRLVLLEQIYRAVQIHKNTPYHK